MKELSMSRTAGNSGSAGKPDRRPQRPPRGASKAVSAKRMVPVERIELPTFGLQNRCSTAELNRQIEGAIKLYFIADARRNRRVVAGSGAVK
jgi:hypothetical protein